MDERTRRKLAEVERRRAELDAEEAAILQEAARMLLERPGPRIAGRLRPDVVAATLATMATEADPIKQQTRSARVSRARIAGEHRKHPFVDALVERGLTVTEAAKAVGYGRSTVQSWYAADDNGRPIPRDAVLKIEKLYGVPASAWRRISE